MAGTYTHLTVVRLLIDDQAILRKLQPEVRTALMSYSEFCQMGAISPDYPYLRLNDNNAKHWANAMHHKYDMATKQNIIHLGIQEIKALNDYDVRKKCLSWFLGYVSHIVVDVTCHPVTNYLVGDYDADNQTAHRISEMHQDVYIYKTRLDEEIGKSEFIKNVIGLCTDPNNRAKIDPDIEKLWNRLLSKTFPNIKRRFDLKFHEWHNALQGILDNVAEEISFIPSRHIRSFAQNEGIAYPRFSEVKTGEYIHDLTTPKGSKSYDEIFDLAKDNVFNVWKLMGDGVFTEATAYKEKIKIWNLDSGKAVETSKVMWENI